MTARALALFVLVAALLTGCSSAPPPRPEATEVTITVTLPNGQPAKDVTLNVLPTSIDQVQGGGKTDASGKVNTKLVPGKYSFSLEGSATAMAAVPQKYHTNNQANTVEIAAGVKDVAIKLSN
jgi:hypothetical protein